MIFTLILCVSVPVKQEQHISVICLVSLARECDKSEVSALCLW